MAEAFGCFAFSKSKDFVADLDGLLNAMNEMHWADGSPKWEAVDTNWGVHLQTKFGEYNGDFSFPTVFPLATVGVYVEGAGGIEYIAKNPSYDECVAAFEIALGEPSLQEIANRLTPFVKKGSFEISCVATAKYRYTLCERLAIFSDGSAERNRYVNGADHNFENISEAV